MKQVFLVLLMISLLLIGCQDENSLIEPVDYSPTESLGKIVRMNDLTLANTTVKSVMSNYSRTYTIDGKRGGRISESHSWTDASGNELWLKATLWIPKNSYEGSLTFDIIFNLQDLSVELYPSPFIFNIPVLLDLEFQGIDLSDMTPDLLTFNYLSPDGESENVKYSSISFMPQQNYLAVWQAELPHFSRYGWCR